MTPPRFPEGSASDKRLEAACVRAIDPWLRLEAHADRLIDALDHVTIPGVVRGPLADDDSLIIAIRDVSSSQE